MNAPTFLWPHFEQIPPLPLEQVHVWAWDLDISSLPHDWEILSEEEALRAQRFVFPRDCDHYVRAHSRMRKILGSYSGISPEAICFSNNTYGKPQIKNASNGQPMQFNLSHSAGMAALAVSRTHQVGIDIEMVRPIDQDIAENHFSSRELRALRNLPPSEWLNGFFRCWTSKEALLKGEGLGLNLPLDAFDVEADPHRPPALLDSRSDANIASSWRLIDLQPALGATGTLAVRDNTGKLSAKAVRFFSLRD